jgi:hypothetical protein
MPAEAFTKRANTPKKRRQWRHVYESMKSRGASPGAAIRAASGVVKRSGRRGKRRSRR